MFLCIFQFAFNAHLIAAEENQDLLANDHCIQCHTENEIMPEGYNKGDIHIQQGLSCAGCHGGDPAQEDMENAMDPRAGFIGVPSKRDIPQFCGRCHSNIEIMRVYQPRIPTDQVEQYYSSVHGQRLREGDKKVASCIDCHTAHAIFDARDPRSTVYAVNVPATCRRCHADSAYMQAYGIPVDQYEKYAKSVHGKALLENQDTGAPACNDCHGNHGAIPPGVASISHVCGTCHVNNMQYFISSKMGQAFEEMKMHACEECHNHHEIKETNDDMIGTGERSVCNNCHAEGDTGYAVSAEIHKQIHQAVVLYDSAEVERSEVARIGMDDVDIDFLLQDAHQNLIQARTLVHTFNPAQVGVKTDASIQKTQEAINVAWQEIRENKRRRQGFGLATVFITLLVVGLFFKIRAMEKKDATNSI